MARILGAIILIGCSPTFAYPRPVAVITNYDDIEESVAITRANGEPDGADALLYPGDWLTGEIALIEADFSPYTELQPDGQAYVVAYNPPSGIWGVTQSVSDKAASFWFNVENVTTGASRGLDSEFNLNPQPGFDVTLLPHQEARFSWDGQANTKFFIKDDKGEIVFEKDAAGVFGIVPSSLGLKEGKKYTWGVDDTLTEYRFIVLDERIEMELSAKLDEIEQEEISANERVLRKVTYVQLISDMYPETIDLYWLGLQWLAEVDTSTGYQQQKRMLLKKCAQHLDREM